MKLYIKIGSQEQFKGKGYYTIQSISTIYTYTHKNSNSNYSNGYYYFIKFKI